MGFAERDPLWSPISIGRPARPAPGGPSEAVDFLGKAWTADVHGRHLPIGPALRCRQARTDSQDVGNGLTWEGALRHASTAQTAQGQKKVNMRTLMWTCVEPPD